MLDSIQSIPDWIQGTILGDTHIDNQNRLCIGHSVLQADYLYHKKELLESLNVYTSEVYSRTSYHKVSMREYTTLSFRTESNFIDRTLYYNDTVKFLPVVTKFTPEMAAYWYMDDGGIASGNSNKGLAYSIHSFNSVDERFFLKNAFSNDLGIPVNFQKQGNSYNRMYIGVRNNASLNFCTMIKSYIIPSLKYKIPFL